VIAAAGMMTTLFLGGWTLPWLGLDQAAGPDHVWLGVAHIGIFLGKTLFLVLVIMWVRWMWPRFRYDQLMDLGWRRFIPLALANIVITAWVLYLRR
jgi:NADH-quinone oxidoreductase subunit H